MSANDPQIYHDSENHRFTLALDNQVAVLEYRLEKTLPERQVVNFTHTFVPPQFRGKGHAEKLVRQGLSWARDQGYEITASCWYVQMFLRSGDASKASPE